MDFYTDCVLLAAMDGWSVGEEQQDRMGAYTNAAAALCDPEAEWMVVMDPMPK